MYPFYVLMLQTQPPHEKPWIIGIIEQGVNYLPRFHSRYITEATAREEIKRLESNHE